MERDEFLGQELEFEALKRAFRGHCEVIRKWMKAEETEMKKNTVDIPEFLKPQEDTFEYRFHSGIRTAVNNNKFWELYDMALKTVSA